ncbi:MAG: hypothetical protein ACK2U9_00510 [Anaerolineae bacterium]
MELATRTDIRALLKQFGILADRAVMDFLESNAGSAPLHIRLTLEDLTDYEDPVPDPPLHLSIEGEVRR